MSSEDPSVPETAGSSENASSAVGENAPASEAPASEAPAPEEPAPEVAAPPENASTPKNGEASEVAQTVDRETAQDAASPANTENSEVGASHNPPETTPEPVTSENQAPLREEAKIDISTPAGDGETKGNGDALPPSYETATSVEGEKPAVTSTSPAAGRPSKSALENGLVAGDKRESAVLSRRSSYGEAVNTPEAIGEEKDDKKKKKEEVPKVSLSRLFCYTDTLDRILMFIGSVAALIHGVGMPSVMLIFGDTVDTLVAGTANSTMNTTNAEADRQRQLDKLQEDMTLQAYYYLIIAAGVMLSTYIQVICWYTVGERLIRRIRRKFYHAVLHQDMAWFDTHHAGELASRLADDILKIQGGIGDKNGIFLQWLSTFITGFAIGFVKGPKLAAVILATAPLLAICATFISKVVADFGTKEQEAYAKAGSVAEEVISAIRTVVAFGGEHKECERYTVELEDARKVGVKKGFTFALGMGITYLLIFCTYGLSFWYGSRLIIDGEITGGEMVTTFFSVIIGSFALGHASPGVQASAEARGAAVAIYNIIDQVPTIDASSDKGEKPEKLEGNFQFENVEFTYPSRPDVPILKGLNMEIKKGTTVALVGPSGCGKSTCVQLVQRFYDPNNGKVTLDGHDLRDLNVRWLRNQIGIVSQEPVLFGTTIKENIAFGSLTEVTDEQITDAAKLANAHNFISALPDGYNTLVGERGAQLSGGQKQRIAIARALIRNPKILLLDEATSALDTESESIVQQALDKARAGRTTIVIAHRLTTVRNADVIVALNNGVMAEHGSHSELMEKQGIYYTLVTMQSVLDEAEKGNTKAAEELLQRITMSPTAPHKDFAASFIRQGSLHRQSSIEDSVMTDILKKVSSPEINRQVSVASATRQKSVVEDKKDKKKEEEEEEEDSDLPDPSGKRMMLLNKPEFPIMVIGALCAAAFGTVMPLFSIIFSEMLDIFRFINDPDRFKKDSDFWSGMFPVLGIGSGLALFFQFYIFALSGEALTLRMRQMAFKAMLRQNIAYFDDPKNSTGSLTTRLSADAALIQGATGARVGSMFQLLSTVLAALLVSFISEWRLTLVLLGLIPMVAIGGAIHTKALAGFGSGQKTELQEAGKVAVEAVDNVRTVVSLGLEERSVDRYMNILKPLFVEAMKKRHVYGITAGFGEAAFFIVYAVTFRFGAFLIAEEGASFEDVFRVFAAMVFSAFSLGQSASFAPDFNKAKRAAARIFYLMDMTPPIDSYSEEGKTLDSVEGNLMLRDVHFFYPTRPEVKVMKGTTIVAKAGQTVALVGQSGCGKSTSVSLLERFYDPIEGSVRLDDADVRNLNLSWLRRQMGIVQQEPILFDSSIADNIAYGALDRHVTMDEIIEAAKNSNIHSFISTLPSGYDTNVGAKGTQLSGGQKQRVAIARALIRNPKILLLDEATSALDTESEKIVQEALDHAREGRTSIVIAHRLSTIQNADKIIVLGGGKVLEEGTHAELIAQKGAYYKLNRAQEEGTEVTMG